MSVEDTHTPQYSVPHARYCIFHVEGVDDLIVNIYLQRKKEKKKKQKRKLTTSCALSSLAQNAPSPSLRYWRKEFLSDLIYLILFNVVTHTRSPYTFTHQYTHSCTRLRAPRPVKDALVLMIIIDNVVNRLICAVQNHNNSSQSFNIVFTLRLYTDFSRLHANSQQRHRQDEETIAQN